MNISYMIFYSLIKSRLFTPVNTFFLIKTKNNVKTPITQKPHVKKGIRITKNVKGVAKLRVTIAQSRY
jgi:hypothetical protein